MVWKESRVGTDERGPWVEPKWDYHSVRRCCLKSLKNCKAEKAGLAERRKNWYPSEDREKANGVEGGPHFYK
ncbi:hypothetical protein ANTQUA_LOCUS5197 [Anthophora quadrimaculata]